MHLKRNLHSAYRNILRNRTSSLINLSSLIVGFSCFILIFFWIKSELSYDNFHAKADRTYRISYDGVVFGKEIKSATTSKPFYESLKKDFPEVEHATLLTNFSEALLTKDDGTAFRAHFSGINPDFFDVFDVPVLKGDIKQLWEPNVVFITSEMSRKFFGDEDPIGKVLSTGMDRGTKDFTVAGLIGKLPANSHLEFDMLYSNESQSWYRRESNNWLNANFHNYVVLKPDTDYKAFEEKFNSHAMEKISHMIRRWHNISIDEWHSQGDWVKFVFDPIQKIHLIPSYSGEYKQGGNVVYIYIFAIVGALILLLSIINFSNLSTVRSLSRSKEIGISKVSGSKSSQIIIRFLTESSLISLIALVVSVVIIALISPFFKSLTGVDLMSSNIFNWWIILGLLTLSLLAGILSGLYPSLYLSKISPVKAFSKTAKLSFKGILLKDSLIVLQFAISIIVIIGTFLISKQLSFLQNENLGFKKENIIVLEGTVDLSHDQNRLLNEELQKLGSVKSSTSSQNIPLDYCNYSLFSLPSELTNESLVLDVLPCDHNYQNVYQFKLIQGRYFDESFSSASRKTILNEKAAQKINGGDCLGKIINREGVDYEIIGVVKDFHYSSKQAEIPPLAIVQLPDVEQFWPPAYCSALVISEDIPAAVSDINMVWDKVAKGKEFQFSFFDKEYNNMYRLEMQTKKLFTIFSFVAIYLSCFGLFGFVNFLVKARIKEIGIRKVNGAKNSSVFIMLSQYFTRPILIAMIIACPIAYLSIKWWLRNFAYRIDIHAAYFLLAGAITFTVVFLTVGWIGWRAASKNPVEALRYE